MTHKLNPRAAWEKMSAGYTYVDVRSDIEFADGHPAGAVNVPVSQMTPTGLSPEPGFVAAMVARFPLDAALILGCRSGGRSARARQLLVDAGYTNVLDQLAGWDGARGPFGEVAEPGWSRCDLPVTRPG